MREIKFKIYDKKLKESHIEELQNFSEDDYWYDGETDMWSVLYDSHHEQERFVALQYIGLKDFKGNEVYEGDILMNRWFNCNGELIEEERYLVEQCIDGWKLKNKCYKRNLKIRYTDKMLVIGNIYDNPKLFEEE